MESLRQLMANVGAMLGRMQASQRLLIVFIGIVCVLMLFIVRQQASTPKLVELLPGSTPAEAQGAATHLAGLGFQTQVEAGRVMIAPGDRSRAVAALAEAQLLPNDRELLFRNILQQQHWANTRDQNEQAFNMALQNELALTISKFDGVKSATVFIDAPQPMGLGLNVRRPTASVTVVTQGSQPLAQGAVDAIAGLVAGSKAGLAIENVAVIDANTGRQRRATSLDQALSTTYLEHANKVELQVREKVMELLSPIRGVVVAVTAQVDVTRVTSSLNAHLPVGQGSITLTKREQQVESNQRGASNAAVPGVEANQTADITRLNADSAGTSTNTTTESENENRFGVRTETVVDPRGFPTKVAISVNIPRSFVVQLLQGEGQAGAEGGDDTPAEPTDEQVAQAFEQRVRPWVVELLRPQVLALAQMDKSLEADELKKAQDAVVAQNIGVTLAPVDMALAGAGGMLGGAGGGGVGGMAGAMGSGGGMFGVSGELIDRIVLITLSVVAMGMMFVMVRKTSKKVETPTAEELVGLPPQIANAGDVVGEASETDTAMAGIEVGEEQMQSQKMLEQVGEMVEQTPEGVARTLNRWIRTED